MTGWLILGGFFVFAGLMIAKALPALLALPLMAAWIALVAQLPLTVYLNDILLGGAMKLGTAMAVVVFGAMFAQVIMKTGVSAAIIKKAAELAGDKPRTIALALALATIFVFMGMSGLGAVIMVGSIALPIMMSSGIKPLKAAVIFLLAIQTGLVANAASYGVYIGVFGGEAVASYYLPAFVISLAVTLAYIFKHICPEAAEETMPPSAPPAASEPRRSFMQTGRQRMGILLRLCRMLLQLPLNILEDLFQQLQLLRHPQTTCLVTKKQKVPGSALLAPLIPLATVYILKALVGFGKAAAGHVDPVAASVLGFFLASLYAIVLTKPGQTINIFAGAVIEGIKDVAGVIFLFMGIGMLVAAVMNPSVSSALHPLLLKLVPTDRWLLLAFFAVLAPTALYRGPLNMYGMGAGIAVLLYSLQVWPPAVIMGIFLGVGYIQGASDPTNSHNTWIAGFTGTDGVEILKKTLPYTWAMCLLMLLYVGLTQW